METVPPPADRRAAVDPRAGRDYVRRLYERIIAWYDSAERKAQLILTLDGVFVSFLAASVFSDPSELRRVVDNFGPETWALLSLMCVALVASIACAVRCLYSRLYSAAELREEYGAQGVDPCDPATQKPQVMWFFQLVSGLDREAFAVRVMTIDDEFETRALADSCVPLARNVAEKHRWVNYGFAAAGVVLVLFLLAGISYMVRAA